MTHPSKPIGGVPCHPRAFLLDGGSLAQLRERYHIETKWHSTYRNLVQLKYGPKSSDYFSEPIVQGCRGLILDAQDDWRIIAWPFDKFFNYGDALTPAIDWKTARVQEKIDGSLMIMYWYDGKWHVATSGMPDADGLVHGTNKQFRQLFWDVWAKKQFIQPPSLNRGYTFMFELTSPFNRVVVPHAEADLHLIGMRSVWSGIEVPIRHRTSYNPVKEFSLQSIEEVMTSFDQMNSLEQEGYVVVDDQFRRIKIKHKDYTALHHMKSSFSVKRVVEVIRGGEASEILSNFPEWTRPFQQVQAAYDGLVTHLEQDYEELRGIHERKAFALEAQKTLHPATMFLLRDSRYPTVKESLKGIHIDKMVEMLGVNGLVLEGAI